MKLYIIRLLAVVTICCGLSRAAATPNSDDPRLGVYDSRAVAVAYAGSPKHEKRIAAAAEMRRKARAEGDTATVTRIEAEGQAQQKRLHRQAFGKEPVDEILAEIPAAVAAIRRDNNLAALVSKWDEAALGSHGGSEVVDVTEALVDALQPNERQRRRALELQAHAGTAP